MARKEHPTASADWPDFRNLGTLLRVLVGVNALAALTVLLQNDFDARLIPALLDMGARLELPLLLVMLGMFVWQGWLVRQRYLLALLVVLMWTALVTLCVCAFFYAQSGSVLLRSLLWSQGAAFLLMLYLDYRARLLSPALAEARLMALSARIRPHFLFNALNGVLGVMRTEPRTAEAALERLAVLFRALMGDGRELLPLAEELQLCRHYIEIESLRLGERLRIDWQVENCPQDALVPPFFLQPLLENAVHYGIEPQPDGGDIVLRGQLRGELLRFQVSNSFCQNTPVRDGNRMAIANIRERLALFFDLEAGLEMRADSQQYHVVLWLPYRQAAAT